jgi:hypothetical protein
MVILKSYIFYAAVLLLTLLAQGATTARLGN